MGGRVDESADLKLELRFVPIYGTNESRLMSHTVYSADNAK